MGAGLADQDTDEDKGQDPRVFLEGVDEGEAEDGEDVGDDGDDDTADADRHGVVRHGAQQLTTDDHIHYSEASTNNHIQYRAELRAPESKRVSRCSDGA